MTLWIGLRQRGNGIDLLGYRFKRRDFRKQRYELSAKRLVVIHCLSKVLIDLVRCCHFPLQLLALLLRLYCLLWRRLMCGFAPGHFLSGSCLELRDRIGITNAESSVEPFRFFALPCLICRVRFAGLLDGNGTILRRLGGIRGDVGLVHAAQINRAALRCAPVLRGPTHFIVPASIETVLGCVTRSLGYGCFSG